MDKITTFLQENNHIDHHLQEYSPDQIDKIAEIISGRTSKSCEDPVLNNYTGLYYASTGNNKLAEKHYKFAAYQGNTDALANLLDNFHYTLSLQDLELFLNSNIDGNYMNNIGVLCRRLGKNDLAIKYYKLSIEYGIVYALINLGYLHYCSGDYIRAERYYKIACKRNEPFAFYRLGTLYFEQEHTESAVEYLKTALENGCTDSFEFMNQHITPLVLYHIYNNLQNKNDAILKKISELEQNYDVKCFINKQKFLSKTAECPICLETRLAIPRECTHYYCVNCYVKIEKCALCRS